MNQGNKRPVFGFAYPHLRVQLLIIMIIVSQFCFALLPGGAAAAVIEKIEVDGLHSISRDELLYLLDLKVGSAVDPLDVRRGIKRAFLKGIFEDIEINADDEHNGLLKVKVRERDVIKSIDVTGNNYLSSRMIRGLFLQKKGMVLRYDLMGESLKVLKQALAEMGFPLAEVSANVERSSSAYMVNVVLKVNEGHPEKIMGIRILGFDNEVRPLMETKEGDYYNQVILRSDLERIKNHYKKLGYVNPSAGPYTYSDGELDISIDPGKRLNIFFTGNSAIGSKALLKEMPFFDAADFRDDLVEEAANRISALYHSKGYPFVQVVPVTAIDNDVINLTLFIYEGKNVSIGSIRFSGITLPEENLRRIISLKEGDVYNPDAMYSEKAALGEFYNAIGYLNVDVSEPEAKIEASMAHILITVKEGRQTLINTVEIRGFVSIPETELRKAIGIKSGDPYNEVNISDARYRVIDIYLEHGFADVNIDVKREFDEQSAKVIFDINEGPVTFFGKTIITGNKQTRIHVLERELMHREGNPFDYSILIKERQKLYRLGLFTDISLENLDKYDSKRDILVNVGEGKAGAVEFGVGFADYEKYRGFIDISYRNLFGIGKHTSFRTELSSLEQRFILNYYDPWFLGRQTPFRALLLREERTDKNIDTKEVEYRLRRHTAAAGFEKKVSDNFKGELYYDFSLVETFDVKPDVILSKEDTGTLAISDIRPGIIYDTRDNPFDPRKGVLAGVTLKVATGLLLSETDFAKLVFNGSFYRELSKRFVLAVSFRGGVAQGFDTTRELPLVERFFLGGRNTVRGYAQDTLGPKGSDGTPTGGNAFLMTNLEIRTNIGKGIGIVTFIDGGNVWIKTNQMNLALKYTAGVGLRYSTPVGPLRIDYGRKLKRETGESGGEIHFSIGHAF